MSERPKALDITPRLDERLRVKLSEQLSELARPFLDWDLEGDKLSSEDEEQLTKLTQDQLLKAVNTEGFRRKHLLELSKRIINRKIDLEDLIGEDEMNDHTARFRLINEIAITKLNSAALFKGTPKKESEELLPDEVGVKLAIEHYARKGLIVREDIEKNGSRELQEVVFTADKEVDVDYRIQWEPSVPPLAQVSLIPEGTNSTEVSPAGPTVSMPAIPPFDKTGFPSDSSINSDRPFDVSHMRALMGKAPTAAVPAMIEEIGNKETVAISALLPSKRPTPVPLSRGSVDRLVEDPEIIMGPAAYITDAHGNEQSGRIPLLDQRGRPSGEFTIGSSPSCDIHIDFPGIAPIHGEVKIEGEKMLIRGKNGAFIKAQGGAITSEWQEISRSEIIKTLPRKGSNGNGPRSAALRMPYFRVNNVDLVNQQELKKALKEKASKLREAFNDIADRKGLDDEVAMQLMTMIRAIIDYDQKKNIGTFTLQELEELAGYTSAIIQKIQEVREQIDQLLTEEKGLQKTRRQFEETKRQNQLDNHAAMCERMAELEVDHFHIAPGENAAAAEVLYTGPAFSLENNSDNKQKVYYPADLLSTITIGKHPINSHTMVGPVKGRVKERIKNFMVELYRDEEDQQFRVRYLEGLVQLQVGEGFMAPPREIFEVKPGQAVRIGNHTLKLEEGVHAFSEEVFMSQLEGEKGLIQELLGQIRNQEHTTWEQDEEALDNLCSILARNLPEERKQKLIEEASQELQKIYEKLLAEVLDWDGGHDSGYFQTLMLLTQASREEGFFREPFPFTDEQLKETARYQVGRYVEEANMAYRAPEEPIKPEAPAEPTVKGIFSFLGIPGAEQRRYEKELAVYEKKLEEYRQEQELYRIKQQDRVEAMKKAKVGAIEIARFIDFGLIDQEKFELQALKDYRDQVRKVIRIRHLFEDLEDENTDHLDVLLTLNKLCKGMDASDIFAPEEISTRSLHCQVDLQKDPHLTGRNSYIHKLGQIHGSKAFERLSVSREAEEDLRLINGLLEAKIITPVELNTKIEEIKTADQIIEALEEKEKEVDSQRTAAERKATKELHAKLLAEEEAKRRDEYLKNVKNISLSKENAQKVDQSNPQAVEEALIGMMMYAPYALHPEMAELMAGTNIRLPKKVEIVELAGDGPNLQLQAEELVKEWEAYQKEWKSVLFKLAQQCAQNVCNVAGLRARQGYTLIEQCLKSGFFSLADLETSEEELIRGVQAEDFAQKNIYEQEPSNFDYLQFQPKDEKDQGFWDDIKAEITEAKLVVMVQEYRAGNKKLLYQRKIKKLQKRDPRAIEMFNDLNLNDEERDLLQLGK